MHTQKGFSLIEVMLALAISMIVFVAVFYFAASIHTYAKKHTATPEKYVSYQYGEPYCGMHKTVQDIHFDTSNQIHFQAYLSTSTRISSIHQLNGNRFVLTTDSASTSESDIFLFDVDAQNTTVTLISSLDVGPGIQDAKLLDQYLYVANTSVNSHLKTLYVTENLISELFNVKLPSLSSSASLPKKLAIYGNTLILGSEKSNSGPELFVFPIEGDGVVRTPIYSMEIDGQANQLLSSYGNILVANAADPELRVYNSLFNIEFTYDAPLTLGNGKSVLYKDPYIILGRTVGSGELSLLLQKGTTTEVLKTKRTYGTVDHIQMLDSETILAMTANEDAELQFWNIPSLDHEKDINIPGRVSAYECTSENLLFISTTINTEPVLLWLEI